MTPGMQFWVGVGRASAFGSVLGSVGVVVCKVLQKDTTFALGYWAISFVLVFVAALAFTYCDRHRKPGR